MKRHEIEIAWLEDQGYVVTTERHDDGFNVLCRAVSGDTEIAGASPLIERAVGIVYSEVKYNT